ADTPAAVIAQTRLDNVAGSPYDFALPYDPSKLRANGQYGLHAGLYGAKGDLIFVTDTRVPFTPGHQDVGEFRMKMARGAPDRAASPSSAGTSTSNSSAGAFHGVGTEPGWTVDVEPNSSGDGSYSLRADLDYGGRKITVPNAQGLDSTSGFGGKTADGMDVTLRIERASCSDGMSDQTFPAAVKLTVGDKTYSGCGRYLGQ
ncbi:MAG: YbaY family lipoprotein, partial [Luteimonas sp.]